MWESCKLIIILISIVNFGALLYSPQPWDQSIAWKEYIQRLLPDRMHQNIINFPTYCDEVSKYQSTSKIYLNSLGIPIRSNKILYADYTYDSYTRKVLSNYTKLVMPEHFTRMNSKYHPWEKLYPEISMFFVHEPAWHDYHEIGKHFLCQGQRYNHIPGNHHLNFKDETANRLQEYAKKHYKGRANCFDPWTILPKTYDLSDLNQCKEYFSQLAQESGPQINWIVKISRYSHNGQGITLIDEENRKLALEEYDYGNKCNEASGFIAQKYINDPFLIDGKKFDFRAYLLIASMDPLMILFHDGFVRITLDQYDPENSDRSKHLTNLDVAENYLHNINASESQFQNALNDQGWGYDQFEEYLVRNGYVEKGWMDNVLRKEMKKYMLHIVRMNLGLMLKHPQVFELFGIDFILDKKLHLWFIEANLTPCVTEKNDMKRDLNSKVLQTIVDMQYAIMYNADFDSVVEGSDFEWIFDDRKMIWEKYHGLLEIECV